MRGVQPGLHGQKVVKSATLGPQSEETQSAIFGLPYLGRTRAPQRPAALRHPPGDHPPGDQTTHLAKALSSLSLSGPESSLSTQVGPLERWKDGRVGSCGELGASLGQAARAVGVQSS